MRMAILMIAAGALTAGAAQAEPVAATGQKTNAAAVTRVSAAKVLYICNEEEDARLVARDMDFGFVTAKQVMAGAAWSGPKCITSNEARRLKAMKISAAR